MAAIITQLKPTMQVFDFIPPGQAPPYQAVEQTPRMQGRKRQSEVSIGNYNTDFTLLRRTR